MNQGKFSFDQPTVSFTKRWHRFALGIFVVCWATMLLPQLLLPDYAVARILTLALLGFGASAVLTLLFGILFKPAYHRGKDHHIVLELNQTGHSEFTDDINPVVWPGGGGHNCGDLGEDLILIGGIRNIPPAPPVPPVGGVQPEGGN